MVYLFIMKDKPTDWTGVLQEASSKAFNGRVDSVYRQTYNHNIKTARLVGGYTFELWPDWEELVQVGDSLAKKRNAYQVKVFKRNGTTITLDYKKMIEGFKK